MQDRLARLELAAQPGDWWHPHKPDKGDGLPQPDKIAGEVLTRSVEEGQFGTRDTIKVHTPEGKVWRVHADDTVLTAQFKEEDPQPGDLVFIAYLGRKLRRGADPDTKDEKDRYYNWRTVADKGPGQSNGTTPAPEPDVPFDTEGLREPQPAMSAAARAEETYGNDVPWDDD